MDMKLIFPYFVVLVTIAAPLHAAECSRSDAIAADAAVDHLNDWNSIEAAFKQYAQCDDGAIGEGFSDAIVKLFANHWDQVPTLQALIDKDPNLEEFVVRHIDETADWDQVKQVRTLAFKSCPKGSDALCKKIIAQIDS